MNLIRLVILTILASLYMSIAQASCQFDLNIGDDASIIEEKYGEPLPMFPGQGMLPIPAIEICPEQKLEDIAVEYVFLENKLAAIMMKVLNDGVTNHSEKLLLLNYVKKTYGNFDTGPNPKAYNSFEVWDEGQAIVVYKRMINMDNIIEEELYISNKEYDLKLGEFYNKLEEGTLDETEQ